jgi:hypothetical protein
MPSATGLRCGARASTTRSHSNCTGFDRALVAALVARLERRLAFELSFANGVIYLTLGRDLLSGPVTAHRLTP